MMMSHCYDESDDTDTIVYEQGFEVSRVQTPQRGRMHTPSPSRRSRSTSSRIPCSPGRRVTPNPSERKNRLLTPIRAFSLRRKKNRVPPGPNSEAALVIRRTQWDEERERIREEERKKKLFDFEIGSTCLSFSCQCWGGSLLVQDEDL